MQSQLHLSRQTDTAAPSETEGRRRGTLARGLSSVLAVAQADSAAIRQTTVLQAVSLVTETAHRKRGIRSPPTDGVVLSTATRLARALSLACAVAFMARAVQAPSTATLLTAIASSERVRVAGTPFPYHRP